jgi:dienelactone hydrolase
MFVHVVLFWLKKDAPADTKQKMIADAETQLKQIPGVRHIWAGRPAMTPRPVVDNSYDVGLCVIYDDKAAHDAYQTHDLHTQFGANYKAHWEKVLVYDFA